MFKKHYKELEDNKDISISQDSINIFLDKVIRISVYKPNGEQNFNYINPDICAFGNELSRYVRSCCRENINKDCDDKSFRKFIKKFTNNDLKDWIKKNSKSSNFQNYIKKYADNLKSKINLFTSAQPLIVEYNEFKKEALTNLKKLHKKYKESKENLKLNFDETIEKLKYYYNMGSDKIDENMIKKLESKLKAYNPI